MNKRINLLLKLGLLALLGCLMGFVGCSSMLSIDFTPDPSLVTRPDPKDPDAPPYVEIEFDGKKQIGISELYQRGFRKVIIKNVPIEVQQKGTFLDVEFKLRGQIKLPKEEDKTITLSSTAIREFVNAYNKETLHISKEVFDKYYGLVIEKNRKYDLWLQLKHTFLGNRVVYVEDIIGLRSSKEIAAAEAARKERVELARKIIVKKYNSLFPSVSKYTSWRNRCDGRAFVRSLTAGQSGPYHENDIFTVEKYSLAVQDVQSSANGYYIYLVGSAGNIPGYSQACYIVSASRIPYVSMNGIAAISRSLLLKYIGREQYRSGYQIRTGNVFLSVESGTAEYENYRNMMDDLRRIEKNPEEYAYILDE